MSVNSVRLRQSNTLPLLHDEDVRTSGHKTDIELRVPATTLGPKRSENAKGRVWVTDQRVIFIADTLDTPGPSSRTADASDPPGYDAPPALTSLEIPFSLLKSCTYHLPTFSANHLIISFLPAPNSSLPNPGRGQSIEAKLIVGEGASHAVWKVIEGERCRAEERRAEEDVLPAYAPA